MKHNNPCGAAKGATLAEAYHKAHMADRLAAFGGAIALNREVDRETAELIAQTYAEVVVAPEFAPGVMEIFSRSGRTCASCGLPAWTRLQAFVGAPYVDFKSLIDGGIVAQTAFVPKTLSRLGLPPGRRRHRRERNTRSSAPPTPTGAG